MARDDAYRIVQESAQQAWDSGTDFKELLAQRLAASLDPPGGVAEEVAGLDWDVYLEHVPELIARLEALRD
jgi:hypothetical protein